MASRPIRDAGYEPALIGGGKFLMPATPLAGEHTLAEIRDIVAKLQAPQGLLPRMLLAI